MFTRKGTSLLLALALLTGVLSAVCLPSAKAESSAPWGVEFAYQKDSNTRLTYVLAGGVSVRLSKILAAFGLSGTVSSVGGRVVNSEGEVDVFAIYDVLDFTYDSGKGDWLITPLGVLDSSNNCTMYVTISGTQYTFTLTWLDGTISGIPPANGGYVYVNGIRWRVIGVSSDKWLLISANVLGGSMNWSSSKAYCGTVYGAFSTLEQSAVLSTTKTDFDYKYEYYTNYINYKAADLNGENLFLPSALEAVIYFSSDSDRKPGGWWLRSLPKNSDNFAGVVYDAGSVLSSSTDSSGFGVRPAFVLNRSSVLFESAAMNGKPAANSGFSAYAEPAISTDRKLTLLDSARSGFTASADVSAVFPGDTLTVTYSGAATGENERVSAMLCDSGGTARYYASVISEGSGTWNMTIPADLAAGSYTLKVFNEQRNNDNLTDYAGSFKSIGLMVVRFAGCGTAEDPWQIAGASDWNKLSAAVASGAETAGKHFRLTENISVSAMIGTAENPFGGHFDGPGRILTVNLESSEAYAAPFRYVSGAVFEHLRVAGTISASAASAAGLAGCALGDCAITDVGVDVDITATAGDGHTGFVAMCSGGTVSVTGSAFTGSITAPNARFCAGFLGWKGSAVKDCVYNGAMSAGADSNDFIRADGTTVNCYSLNTDGIARVKGQRAFAVEAGNGAVIDFGEGTQYASSSIEAYPAGLKYTIVGYPKFYAGEGETVTLRLSVNMIPPEGIQPTGFTASAGTLTPSGAVWTLLMPREDVVIRAAYAGAFGEADLVLPAGVKAVGANAFKDTAAETVYIPDGCESIGDGAFANCRGLRRIRIPADCGIGEGAFERSDFLYVFGTTGSPAETYCANHGRCLFVQELKN